MLTHINAPKIVIQQLHATYGRHVLFDNLNITFESNRCSCLLGKSGVGKSTLLKLIAGLIPSQQGRIHCDNNQSLSQQIAYMAQTDLLLPWYSVLDNVLISTRLRGKISSDARHAAKTLLEKVGLTHASHKFPYQLSGGMRQRAALVRTLLTDKPILLMDEPFSSVDAITRFQLQTLLSEFLKNRTTLLVTHDPLEALRLADDIYILKGEPAKLHKIITLTSPAPREFSNSEILQQQENLFHLLSVTEEKLS